MADEKYSLLTWEIAVGNSPILSSKVGGKELELVTSYDNLSDHFNLDSPQSLATISKAPISESAVKSLLLPPSPPKKWSHLSFFGGTYDSPYKRRSNLSYQTKEQGKSFYGRKLRFVKRKEKKKAREQRQALNRACQNLEEAKMTTSGFGPWS